MAVKTMLLVHAHPDDESILTGGVIARAHLDGHRVVLVTATKGEQGEIAHVDGVPADEASARDQLGEVRSEELAAACEILGVDRTEMLGYRDSGDGGAVNDARSFNAAEVDDVAARIAVLLREELPEVVVTYSSDGTYEHPDHTKAHAATMRALDMCADGWQPLKVYLHAVPRSFVGTVLAAARAADIELPEGLARIEGVPDDEITTVVDVYDVLDRKLAACVAHRSQMHPGLPLAAMVADVFVTAFGVERFVLTRGELGAERPEPSLFSGLE
jgi:N-acetyl-1-D-myo-inositol-2-amino-2-deoxy-alpha-D-glucopyranoside deacetylase